MQYAIGDATILAYDDGKADIQLADGRAFEFACVCEARRAAEERLPNHECLPSHRSPAPDCVVCNDALAETLPHERPLSAPS